MLLAGCHANKESKGTILKPIEKHIVGKWEMTGNSSFVDGKWEENANEQNVSFVMNFRPGGSELRVMTYPDGFTALATTTWSVDEAAGKLMSNGESTLLKLTADELELGGSYSRNPETGEIYKKESKWTYRRMAESETTLAEWLVGKWQFSKSYEQQKDGKWTEISFALPNEATFIFNEDGLGEMHSRQGEVVQDSEGAQWSVNATTGELRLKKEENQRVNKIEKVDENTLCVYYDENMDLVTKEIRKGAFKDILIRAGK